MQCEDARESLSAWIDDALPPDRQRLIGAHVATCAACRVIAEDYRRIGRRLQAIGREPPPADLAERISARIAAERDLPALAPPSQRRFDWQPLLRQAAMLFLVAGISAGATWTVSRSNFEQSRLQQDVIAAHIRSLLQDNTIQIASSDQHTVKPWFTGRIDFPVTVQDLAKEGFPLAGGRLDYIGGQRTAALVYNRRQHTINVFIWPAGGPEATTRHPADVRGYNTVTWVSGGMRHWAVSDLNAAELQQFATLF